MTLRADVNSRLERFADGQVTFRYRDGRTGTLKRCTLDAMAFLGRFLQHVLRQGFAKVRHYGLFSPSRHALLAHAREQLVTASASPPPAEAPSDLAPGLARPPAPVAPPRCSTCGIGILHLVETLRPSGRSP